MNVPGVIGSSLAANRTYDARSFHDVTSNCLCKPKVTRFLGEFVLNGLNTVTASVPEVFEP